MAQSGGPVVGPPSKESPDPSVSTTSTEHPMVIPLGLDVSVVGPPSKESTGRFVKPSVSTTSTGAPMVISVSSTTTAAPMVIGSPSEASPGRFVKPSVSTTSDGAPMVIPLGLSVSSTPTADPMVIPTRLPSKTPALKEHPRLSPFTSSKVPTADKRERPGPPTGIDVGPEANIFAVATKADDANVPEHLWDLIFLKVKWVPTSQEGKALTLLREVLLKRWRKITTRSLLNLLDLKPTNLVIAKQDDGQYGWLTSGRKDYCTWWHGSPRAGNQDVEIGRDCVQQISDPSWWNWDGGPTPFFWRWPSKFRTQMRDGTPLWLDSNLAPSYRRPKRAERNPTLKARFKEKMDKVLTRIYFEVCLVKSLTTFFGVPKREDVMRVVYDGSLPVLNASLWCHWFMLPNTNSHLRTVEP
jgi:hypothetical protein